MESVVKLRPLLGNPTTRSAIRRNLLGFLLIFGLINVILILLYPQIYGGEFFAKLGPMAQQDLGATSIEETEIHGKMEHRNRIFSSGQDRTATSMDKFSKLEILRENDNRPQMWKVKPYERVNKFGNKNIPKNGPRLQERTAQNKEKEITSVPPRDSRLVDNVLWSNRGADKIQKNPSTNAPTSKKDDNKMVIVEDSNGKIRNSPTKLAEKAKTTHVPSARKNPAEITSHATVEDSNGKIRNIPTKLVEKAKTTHVPVPSARKNPTEITSHATVEAYQGETRKTGPVIESSVKPNGIRLPQVTYVEKSTESFDVTKSHALANGSILTTVRNEMDTASKLLKQHVEKTSGKEYVVTGGVAKTTARSSGSKLSTKKGENSTGSSDTKLTKTSTQIGGENLEKLKAPPKAPQNLAEEVQCKPYVLSQKALKYTAETYKLNPEITKCKGKMGTNYELCQVSETRSNEPLSTLQIKCDLAVCDRTKTVSVEVMDNKDGKMKQHVLPTGASEAQVEKLVHQHAERTRKNSLPFLYINCVHKQNGKNIGQLLTFLPTLLSKDAKADRHKININMFLVDSVSRPHFYRSFPNTISYLKEISADPKYPAHVFNFELFQAVHGHTHENERALFDGKLFPIKKLGAKARTRAPITFALYGVFKKAGFQTMFLDDLCWKSVWGIMDKYKTGSWGSLQDKLSTSNIDTRGMTESACTLLGRNNMKTPFYASPNHQICFNGKHQHDYILDYLTRYLDAVATTPQSKPTFAYTSTHVSHDNAGIRVQTLDDHLKAFVQKMSTKEDTLTIIFADHGNTYTSYQATDDGKQEMYHPFMLLVLPKRLGERFGKTVVGNLQLNQRRLFTLFDVRAGLVELARYDGQGPLNPVGIFDKLASNRTCNNLIVTEASKCLCKGWETPVANTTDQLAFAEFAIGQLNSKIQASLLESRAAGLPQDKTRLIFGACQRLRVENIRSVKTRKTPSGATATTMDVRVQSGNLLNQEEIITVQVLSQPKQAGSLEMSLVYFNRISTYGPYRTCMDKNVDVKLCVCNNPKQPFPASTIQDVVGKHSVVTEVQRCVYEIRRSYTDKKTGARVDVYEIANVCKNEEFTVTFNAVSENMELSTKLPITVNLPTQTAQFVATAIGKTKNAKLEVTWQVNQSSNTRK